MEKTAVVPLEQIGERIRKIIAEELKVEETQVTEDAMLADLGGDSLAALAIISNLETQFKVQIPDEDLARMVSFRDCRDIVRRLLAEA